MYAMKRIILATLLGLFAFAAYGQSQNEDINQRFFDVKIREFVYRLNLSDSQRDAFIPIYKRYNDEMRATIGVPDLSKERPSTTEEATAEAKARIERQQKAQAIRLKYVEEFAAVLDPDQLSRLYEVENYIQRKLLGRKYGKNRAGQSVSNNQ